MERGKQRTDTLNNVAWKNLRKWACKGDSGDLFNVRFVVLNRAIMA